MNNGNGMQLQLMQFLMGFRYFPALSKGFLWRKLFYKQQTLKSHLFLPWHAGVWGGPQSSAGSLLSPAWMNPAGQMSNILLSCIRFYDITSVVEAVFKWWWIYEWSPVFQKHWAPASWALTGCGWSGLCASSLWSTQQRRAEGQSGPSETTGLKILTSKGYNPLTPLLFFRARICEALPGDMDPVTGLCHGDRERERESIGTESNMFTLILLHIVIITVLNMTQRKDSTSAPFNLICFLGTEQRRSARERREDEIVFGLMRFWTLVSVKWHAVLLSIWAKALLERWLYSLGATLSLAWGSSVQHGIRAPPSTVTQCGLCLFVNSHLTGLKEPDSLEFPSNCPTKDSLHFY